MAVDTDRLNAFLGRFVSDLGATVADVGCGLEIGRAHV